MINANKRAAKYIGQIMNGAHLDPVELKAMLKNENADAPFNAIIGEAMLRLYHSTDSGFDVIAVAGELDRVGQLESIGGLPGLMVFLDEESDKCPHCGQSYVAPTTN